MKHFSSILNRWKIITCRKFFVKRNFHVSLENSSDHIFQYCYCNHVERLKELKDSAWVHFFQTVCVVILLRGFEFKTHSDCEIFIPLYEKYGENFMKKCKLLGMYAVTIFLMISSRMFTFWVCDLWRKDRNTPKQSYNNCEA